MIPGKYSGLVTCVAAAGMGMFVAMWLLDFAVVRAGWCASDPAETMAECARGWISALSGWVAAAGALLAAGLTLPHLKRQAEESKKQAIEAKRQADFALGEGSPTFDVYSEFNNAVYLRIVNWNRRTIILDTIRFSGIEQIKLETIEYNKNGPQTIGNLDYFDGKSLLFIPPIRINGYENKSQPPHSFIIKASVPMDKKGDRIVKSIFFAHGKKLGEEHGAIELTATTDIRMIDFSDIEI